PPTTSIRATAISATWAISRPPNASGSKPSSGSTRRYRSAMRTASAWPGGAMPARPDGCCRRRCAAAQRPATPATLDPVADAESAESARLAAHGRARRRGRKGPARAVPARMDSGRGPGPRTFQQGTLHHRHHQVEFVLAHLEARREAQRVLAAVDHAQAALAQPLLGGAGAIAL